MKKTARQGLSWDQEYKPYVDQIRNSLKGFGADGDPTSTELFLLFLAFGVKTGTKRPVPARKTDGPRFEYMSPEQKALIKASSLSVMNDADDLLDEDSVYDEAEMFAGGGLFLLSDAFDKNPDFGTWMKTKLIEFTKAP